MTMTSTAAWRNWQSKEAGGGGWGAGLHAGPLDGRWSRPSARAVPMGVVVWLPCRKDARFFTPHSRRLPACLLVTWLRPSSPGSGATRAGFCLASLSKLRWGWGGVLARPLEAVLRMGESWRFQKLGPLEHRLQAKADGDSGLSRDLTRAGAGPRPGHLKPLGRLPFSQGPVFACPRVPPIPLSEDFWHHLVQPGSSCPSPAVSPYGPGAPQGLAGIPGRRLFQKRWLGSARSAVAGGGVMWPAARRRGGGVELAGRAALSCRAGDRGPGDDGLAQAVGWSRVAPDLAGPRPSSPDSCPWGPLSCLRSRINGRSFWEAWWPVSPSSYSTDWEWGSE